ncbi:MAG: hypothetical protein AAGD25_35050 [Cyanobacteria bacterium P01_F01_bin.150]
MSKSEKAYEILYEIYNQYRKQYRENSYDSRQMCLMWSTNDPPDEIEGTDPFIDIEVAFDIEISDEDAMILYDMTLDEAIVKILELQAIA